MVAHDDWTQQPPTSRAWLAHIPAPRRGPVANWFHLAVRGGAQTSVQVLAAVRLSCARRLARSDHPDATLVLSTLHADPAGALAYAQSVIVYKALPYEQRQHVKAQRAVQYLQRSMRGKPATEAQQRFLQRLGYAGALPVDRSEASALIDALLRKKGGAA